CIDAATKAAEKGVEAEVIDLRTLVPLDEPTVLTSVKKTGRAVVVYEAPRTGGYGAEISAILAEKAIEYLRGPIVRVTGFDTPFGNGRRNASPTMRLAIEIRIKITAAKRTSPPRTDIPTGRLIVTLP